MKILMLTEYFPPYTLGGSEWSVYNLAKELAKKGEKVVILTPHYQGAYSETVEGFKIERFPLIPKIKFKSVISPTTFSNPLWWLYTLYFVRKFIRLYQIDILHVQGKYFLPAATIIRKFYGIPTITTLRDYIVLCPYGFCISKKRGYRACTLLDLLFAYLPLLISRFFPHHHQ